MLYPLLRGVASIGLRWYYRSIELEGLERIPAHGPVIIAANHWNALVDALIIGCAIPRRVRLTAKATLLDNPISRLVVHAVGIIPLRRVSDEARTSDAAISESRNATAFSAILDALADGEVVLIFPEGKSHSEPELAPLKTGCARLALMARVERGVPDVPIIPVGLTFEAKGIPRSRVVMVVGEPVRAESLAKLTPESVVTLTARIDRALREVTLNFPSHHEGERLLEISALLTRVLDRVRPLTAPDPPLGDSLRLTQRLDDARRKLPETSAETMKRVQSFLKQLDAFRDRLQTHAIPVNDLWMPLSVGSGAWFALREVAITVALLPVAAWGRLNHWLPLFLARWVARKTATTPDEPAMHTLVSGVLLVFAVYLAVALIVAARVGPWWAMGYLATIPFSATVHFWLTERVRRARERARAYVTLRANPHLQADLRLEASALRAEARRLDEVLR